MKTINQFRPFYREIIKLFISELPKIKKFIISKSSKNNSKPSKNSKNTRRLKGG